MFGQTTGASDPAHEGLSNSADVWTDDFIPGRTPSPEHPQTQLPTRPPKHPAQAPAQHTKSMKPAKPATHPTAHQPQVLRNDVEEVAIAVMGATGSGKTTFINLVSGSQMKVSDRLRSCTKIVETATPLELDGRRVVLIDTPGFDDTSMSDTDILKMIALFLTSTYETGRKLAGVIYIHRISDFKMGGTSTRNFRMFRNLCGDDSLKNVVILTNMWGEVGKEVGEARERELQNEDIFFKPVLDKGALMVRHDATLASAHRVIRYLIHKDPALLKVVQQISIEGKEVLETDAGEELNRALNEQMRKHKQEMAALQEEWKAALEEKDEEAKRELEEAAGKLKAEMSRIEGEAKKLAETFQKEKEELQKKMEAMDAEAKREQNRIQEEYAQKINELKELRNSDSSASKARQAELSQQIEELKKKATSGGWFSNLGRAIDRLFGIR